MKNKRLKSLIGLSALALAGATTVINPFYFRDSEERLLARMIYGESRNCSEEEQIKVAFTTVNRANDGKKWNGSTLRQALLKPHQYTCFTKGLSPNNLVNNLRLRTADILDSNEFQNSLNVSKKVLDGEFDKFNDGETHYHTTKIHPYWASSPQLTRISTPDNFKHKFYREN
jgi:spore germination cell wall hydrolase CwlJ-like protein